MIAYANAIASGVQNVKSMYSYAMVCSLKGIVVLLTEALCAYPYLQDAVAGGVSVYCSVQGVCMLGYRGLTYS